MGIMKNLNDINSGNFMVVDKDTGTVLGTNLVLVPVPADETALEEILSSDSAAFDYATENGIPLLAEVDA